MFFLFNLILSFIFFSKNVEFIKNSYSDYSNIYLKDLKSKKFIPNNLFEINIKRFSYNQINYFEKLKDKIVYLNMQGMPLQKEDLDIIVQFTHLKKLNLN